MTKGVDSMSLLQGRRSIRCFQDRPLSRMLIASLVEAATWAPSSGNRQSWEFTVVTSREILKAMAAAVTARWTQLLTGVESGVAEELKEYSRNFNWFAAAPAVVVVSTRGPDEFMKRVAGLEAEDVSGLKISAAMAAENLMLAAHGAGVGSCCLTGPLAAQAELKKMLGLGQRQMLVCLIAIGYPAEEPAVPPRKDASRVMRFVE